MKALRIDGQFTRNSRRLSTTPLRIRYFYIWTVYTLGGITGSFAQATVLISAASAALLVAISSIFFWNSKSTLPLYLAPPLFCAAGLYSMARFSTPDAMAVLAAAALCLCIAQKKYSFSIILIILLPLFRTDYIIFSCLSVVFLSLKNRSWMFALSMPVALAIYFLANHFSGNYGHAIIFNFTLISGPQPDPEGMEISQDISDYLSAYKNGIVRMISKNGFIIFILASTLGLMYLLSERFSGKNRFSYPGGRNSVCSGAFCAVPIRVCQKLFYPCLVVLDVCFGDCVGVCRVSKQGFGSIMSKRNADMLPSLDRRFRRLLS